MTDSNAIKELFRGIKDGIPIALGYLGVAFSLGITAKNAGIPAQLSFFSSFLIRASAGEYGVYTSMAANAAYFEVVAICLIANLRYLLMSTALTQKFAPGMPIWKRIVCAFCVTDEIFGISIAHKSPLPMAYPLGATIIAGSFWGAGMALGITAGTVLPSNILSALSVALYGMFIAVIIPQCRKDKAVAIVVTCSFLLSTLAGKLLPEISAGSMTIILTIVISSLAAIVKPIDENRV